MNTQLAPKLASDKQISYIKSLADQRQMTGVLTAAVSITLDAHTAGRLTSRQASDVIDSLLNLPWKPKPAAVTFAAAPAAASPLEGIPNSKYAVPVMHAETMKPVLRFFEVRVYKGHKYLRELHGAPGDFNRSKVAGGLYAAVITAIKQSPAAAAKRFADEYSCCARCLSPLTDAKSRELGLGPNCRKAF